MWEQAKALQEGAEIVVCTPVSHASQLLSVSNLYFFLQQQVDHLLFVCREGPSDRSCQEEGHIPAESDLLGV